MSERSGTEEDETERVELVTDEGVGEGSRPFLDNVFAALADWRRREICKFFRETDATTATVDELAMVLRGCFAAAVEESEPPSQAQLVTDLEDDHLPRLQAAGVVDYDDRSNTVHYWGQATVDKWLEHALAQDRFDR